MNVPTQEIHTICLSNMVEWLKYFNNNCCIVESWKIHQLFNTQGWEPYQYQSGINSLEVSRRITCPQFTLEDLKNSF